MSTKYLTFSINGTSKSGSLVIIGPFDHSYGFSVSVASSAPSVFSGEGICLKKGEKDFAEFSVSIRQPFVKRRFNLKFAKAEETNYTVQSSGQVAIADIEVVDSPRDQP